MNANLHMNWIVILAKEEGVYVTGDPMVGKQEVAADQIASMFGFTGFFMEVVRVPVVP